MGQLEQYVLSQAVPGQDLQLSGVVEWIEWRSQANPTPPAKMPSCVLKLRNDTTGIILQERQRITFNIFMQMVDVRAYDLPVGNAGIFSIMWSAKDARRATR